MVCKSYWKKIWLVCSMNFDLKSSSEIKYRLTNISKRFKDKSILEDVSLNIPEKGILVISGPSGEGKTTLLKIMAGLIKPDSGHIEGFTDTRIAFVFQEDRLLPWFDLLSNIKCVLKGENTEDRAMYWLEKMYLKDSYNKYPNELSGGMKRRAALARAFAYSGDLYILDEPYKELDLELKEKIIYTTKEECKDKMLIVVTHDINEANMLLN